MFLKNKQDAYLLKELELRWKNHLIMNKWLQKFFMYLDRYFVKHHSFPTLALSGLRQFKVRSGPLVQRSSLISHLFTFQLPDL